MVSTVVIVGGGPIGLAQAWGIKKLNPALDVVVLEKYEQYQRKHTLMMQHKKLEYLMQVTGALENSSLLALLHQLQKDPHIRTTSLEEVFKSVAMDSGVKIIHEEIKAETIDEQLFERFSDACLIIGADGTHSVISHTLFPQGNQVKHEFDYVLQLRYEMNGEEKAESISSLDFYQSMARQGLVANEYVGHFEDGKTPVTLQMMISKQDFEALREATSKNPLKPFAAASNERLEQHRLVDLPEKLSKFISDYLTAKLKSCQQRMDSIDRESIRVSVNEAPATHAKQVFYFPPRHENVAVTLAGDAGLGLSYFKGLNAGLESTARFLADLKPVLQDGLKNKQELTKALQSYQTWFVEDYSPKKVREVSEYSTWRIRSAMRAFEIARYFKNASVGDDSFDKTSIVKAYFDLLAQNPSADFRKGNELHLFPHRGYDPVKLGQWEYIPIQHTLRKIAKIFVDYFKPYKSSFQFRQDMKQPLVGLANVGNGTAKLIMGILKLDGWRLLDGLFNLGRGLIEIILTPLAWFIKPMTRGIATLIRGNISIEKNKGIQKLAHTGQDYLHSISQDAEDISSPNKVYALLALSEDIHRKFDKAKRRGQNTQLELEEHARYSEVKTSSKLTQTVLRNYFSLFYTPKETPSMTDREQCDLNTGVIS
jgi:2-polyprenyl-6-methoxyphenol hydroxylase-like FAD-dependent oxidoreductase